MQKKKIKMRIMSFLLCILMVFTSIPLDAAAMSYSNSEGESNFLSMIDEELERFEASGETELYKDYAVEDHQNDLEDYQNADKLSLEMLADDSNSNDLTISIEKYDESGKGRWLIRPKKIAKRQYYNDDVISAIREAYGSDDYVKCDSTDRTDGVSADYYYITSVYDVDQEDNYLANGEMGSDSKWEIYINNQEWSHTRYVPDYYLKAGDVVRLVYTTDNTQNPVATNRDELIKIIGEYAPEIWYEPNVGYEELQAALNILVDLGATSEDIKVAKNDLINAFSATTVEISQGAEYMLGLDKTVTLKASVTPKNTKDKVVWSTNDAKIATVDADTGVVKGVSEGTVTITATAGRVSDSINVTVGKIPATNVVIKNEDKITIEKRFDVQLETEVTPADTTDVVRWSSADENIATVDANGLVHGVSVGSTTITATVGDKTDTCQIQVVDTTSPYVYFRYADGSVQEMVNNTFTLTALDVGKFVVGNYNETVKWSCSDTGSDGAGGYEYRYWIDNDGDYNPFEVKKMQATVSGTGLSKSFYIDTVSSGISSIKASIGDKEVSIDNPYEVTGIASGIPVTVKGLNKNSEWVNVPEQAFKSTSTDSTGNIRVYAGLLDINTEGEAEITITMIDNADAKTSFEAKCNSVKVEKIKVHAPENFVIDKWDSQGSGYVGITHGYESSNSEYYITYTPSNATNQEVIWEDLTPEIAEFHELHSAGIVPKKAGLAKFKVISQSNQNAYDEVSINFTYKTPLTNATVSQSSYKMEAGTSEDLVITMVPENATEQRFSWTYDKEGIVKVNESVSADTTTRYISRKIIALSNGKVTVTGTPLDSTGNCQPIKFEVTVGGGSGNVETIDYLEMAKADIKHGLSYLSNQINYNHGSEWTLFTYLRAGGTIENANNYFSSVETELNNNAQYLSATDYARLVITLPLLGQNPTNFAGFNLVEKLYNNGSLGSQTSNQISWTLLALDSHKYEIPGNAIWTRENLIEKILTFQAENGGFGLSGKSSGSVDMTGMILQALAPYNTEEYPEVQSAFSKAVNYLKSEINENVGYIAEGGENGCTAAQVLTALSIAKIDPTNSANGFVLGNKNLITNLDSFKQPSGFAYLLGQGTNLQGTQQITYALEAYRRYAENENSLYDLTDIVLPEETPEETISIKVETFDGKELSVTEKGTQSVNGVDIPVLEVGYTEGTNYVKVILSGTYKVYDCDGYEENETYLSTIPYFGDYYTLKKEGEQNVEYVIKFVKVTKETFTITLPTGEGYVATAAEGSTSPVEKGASYSFTVEISNGYKAGENFTVKANDAVLEPNNSANLLTKAFNYVLNLFGADRSVTKEFTYTIENIKENQSVTVEGVEKETTTAALPITVTVDGEPIEVTSLGERPYLSSRWKDKYTKPVYTVKVPANTDFVIGKTETGDGASGINRVFAMADGVSMDGAYPYTITAANLNNYYVLSTEEFVERVGTETGLDTNNKVAFIEVKDSNYERLYVLLVELISSGDDTPEDTMPIKAETLDGKKLTVTEKGKQSVKGKDVPVLEIGVYEGTTSVRVTPRDSYQVYDDMGSTPENASNLSTVPMFGDFYTLTKDGGRTVDYVIKFVIVEEKLLPIKAETLDGNPLNVTQNGEHVVGNASVPVLEIGIAEGIDAVKVIPSGGYQVYDDMGSTPENASNLSTVPMFGDFYTLTKDGGRTVDYVIKFVKTEPVTETFTVTLPTGEGYTATAEEGSTSPVEKGSDFSFTVKVLSGFKPGENFAVKANGTVLEPNSNDTLLTRAFNYIISLFNENEIKGKEYHYTIKDIQENQNITVENIERLTTTDNLAIISGDEVYDVSKLGNMSYKQADFGTVSDVPVYKATLPADADFEISWDANKDGGKTSSRYAFAIDAGGDMREKYYPLEMEAENIEAYVLTPEQIKKYFGEEISLNLEHKIAFIEIYDGEHIEADLRLLYGLFIEFAPEIVETFNVTLPTGDGYTVVPESTSLINKGESYSFEVKIDAAYDGSNMIVKANGNILEKANGKYTIENILSNQIITIEGVVPKVVSSITVKFAMFGDYVHEEGEEALHTLYDGNLELWIDAKEYNVSSKAKVIDVIDLAFSENNLTYRNTGNYISHVTRNGVTLGAFTNGSLSGWMYTLNGAYSNLGVEEQGLKDGDIIVFYYTDDYTKEDHSITLEKIGNVTGLINDLPENITLDDEAKVIAAEEGYLALNEYQKILIRNYEKLAAAGKELAELKKSAEDEEKASKVEDFIDEIGEVTLSSKEKIDQAFAEYEKLTDIQKKLVDNYDELIAAKNKLILLENAKHEEVYRTTGDYLEQLAKESENAVFGSEWVMFGLSRSGRKIPAAYIKDVASYVAKTIDGSGRLDRTRSTENSRLILALTAAGNNAMDVAGYNLLSGLSDMKFVTKQGINGSIFALIALQCHEDYEIPKVATGGTQTSVDALIDEILDKELTTGGWNLGGKEKPLDADVTAMAIQALAPYYNDASVKKAIDKALDELSKIQNEEGAFGSVDGASSESCAQVIVALTSLGINPETDTRFVKNGNSVVDALCSFYVEDGGFKHVASGELNGMASEQGYYAMTAYMRLLNNQASLYDMNDVVLNGMIVSPNEPDTPDTPNTETSDADKKAAKQVEDIIDAIGRVTIYSENRIKEARKAYNNLTSAQKKLVSNYDVLLAAEEKYEDAKVAYVEDLIDSIGTVSLNSKTAINRARIAYNLLSAASKAEVYNYDKLVAAETLYAKLLSEDKNTVNKAETNKSNKTNKTNATTVKNSPIEKTKIAEYVDDLLESINRDSLNGEIFDAIMAYEELTDVEKISLDKESLVADLKQMLSEKIHVDQKTGILVSGAEWDVRLVVEDVSNMGRIQSMQDKMENAVLLGLWDISLVKMYGNEKYQPEETVLVKIPLKLLGDYTSYEGLVIAHYTDEGQTEYLNCTIMGEYLVFNAIDFSDYAVIGYNDGSAFHDALNGTDDYNGTAMEWIPWTIAGGCSMALLAVLFLMLKKRNEKINKENR